MLWTAYFHLFIETDEKPRTAALPFRVVQLRYIRVRSTSFSSRARFPAATSSFYLVFAKSRRQSEASWLKYFVMRAASIEIVATNLSRYNRESVVEQICVEFQFLRNGSLRPIPNNLFCQVVCGSVASRSSRYEESFGGCRL